MTNKYMYFIANWKMYGDPKSINSLNKVINFLKHNKNNKFKLVYCPPYTLISLFSEKLKKTNISIGGQNCHEDESYGPHTGFINSKMLKSIGAEYVIIGHSENREIGETNKIINKKIQSALRNNLKVILCVGETSREKKKNKTFQILNTQLRMGLKKVKKLNNLIIAYEPVWSIGTGVIPKTDELKKNIQYIKSLLKSKLRLKKTVVLYGGSVSPKNINKLKDINNIDGFLIGGASQNSKKFIDIVKKTFI